MTRPRSLRIPIISVSRNRECRGVLRVGHIGPIDESWLIFRSARYSVVLPTLSPTPVTSPPPPDEPTTPERRQDRSRPNVKPSKPQSEQNRRGRKRERNGERLRSGWICSARSWVIERIVSWRRRWREIGMRRSLTGRWIGFWLVISGM